MTRRRNCLCILESTKQADQSIQMLEKCSVRDRMAESFTKWIINIRERKYVTVRMAIRFLEHERPVRYEEV